MTATTVDSPAIATASILAPINNDAFLEQLADITPPAEPALWPAAVTLLAMLLIVSALLYLHRRHRSQRPRATATTDTAREALERLTAVEQAWSNGDIDTRETAYQLTTLLRLGLNLPQLTRHCPPQLADNQLEWRQTIALFERLRYRAQVAQPLTTATFNQMREWLTTSQQPTRGEERGARDV